MPHVDFVTPSVHFDAKLTRRGTADPARSIGQPGAGVGPKTTGQLATTTLPTGLATCDEYITLECLRALYQIPETVTATGSNSYGIGMRMIGFAMLSLSEVCCPYSGIHTRGLPPT